MLENEKVCKRALKKETEFEKIKWKNPDLPTPVDDKWALVGKLYTSYLLSGNSDLEILFEISQD